MARHIDPIPDRVRGAGLVMIILGLLVGAMPVGVALGASLDRGVGIWVFGGGVVIVPSMLPWLAPPAIATFVTGLLVYFGRFLREGLVVALGWTIALALVAPTFAVLFAIVSYSLWTGRRRWEARTAASLS